MAVAKQAALSAQDVRVTLAGVDILHGVSMEVAAGEAVALMGGNGSGKSTLVRAAIGALPLSAGTISIFGSPVASADRSRIGYVPQRVSAAAGVSATAAEVVESGLLGKRRLALPRGARARAVSALDAVGLGDRARQNVMTMSGGQQQRVLIARAMIREPQLLILDEPVSGVDTPSQEVFADALMTLKSRGSTIIIVLHEIGTNEALIDRAVVLDHGCVVHDGKPPHAHGSHALPGHIHEHPHGDEVTHPDEPTFEIRV